MLIFDEITDRLFVAAFSTNALHSNQKHGQNTIEFHFVKLKRQSKFAIFIDLLGFPKVLSFLA